MGTHSLNWQEDFGRTGTYVIFDSSLTPNLDAAKYVETLNSKNHKKNVGRALMLWFEFLEKNHIHYSRVEIDHIRRFRDWVKTPEQYRHENIIPMGVNPAIKSSSWMTYLESIAGFYERYVCIKFPDCKISFKTKVGYSTGYTKKEKYIFGEKGMRFQPESKAILPLDFAAILNCCTCDRDMLILELFYLTGIRRGELFNIDYRQFLEVRRGDGIYSVKIRISYSANADADKQTKSGGRHIAVPIGLAERLSAYVHNKIDGRVVGKSEHNELFTVRKSTNGSNRGDPLKAGTVYNIFKSAAKKAGFPNATLHHLRHSYTTNMTNFGLPTKEIMDQLGHKSIQTTFLYRSGMLEPSIREKLLSAVEQMYKQALD